MANTKGESEVSSSRILPASPENITRAASVIRGGGLVSFPTETVYGLGADAFNPLAVAKIFEVKNRPSFDPLIVHVHTPAQLERLTIEVSRLASMLIDAFWPGPLTLVLKKSEGVPDIVTAGLSTVAVRMPAHEAARDLIAESGSPIAAPSANPFGYLSPTTAAHVASQLGEGVDVILDGGACAIGLESTIIRIDESELVLLRPGGLPIEEIEKVAGKLMPASLESVARPDAPGQLASHYAPRTRLLIVEDVAALVPEKNSGLLAFSSSPPSVLNQFRMVEILSSGGELREAAARFFQCLHRLDGAGLDVIYAQSVPEIGLGRAIMNRLRKSSADRNSS